MERPLRAPDKIVKKEVKQKQQEKKERGEGGWGGGREKEKEKGVYDPYCSNATNVVVQIQFFISIEFTRNIDRVWESKELF
jgi:hypothetical protein